MFYDYNLPPRDDVAVISMSAANCAMIALGFVILVTMFQITVSIQLLYDEITVKSATIKRVIFNIISCCCVIAHVSLMTAIYLEATLGAIFVASLECTMTIFLAIVFCFVLVLFLKKLSLFNIRK